MPYTIEYMLFRAMSKCDKFTGTGCLRVKTGAKVQILYIMGNQWKELIKAMAVNWHIKEKY